MRRLFDSRRAHTWPPRVQVADGWDTIYREASAGLPVLDDVEGAVAWTNDLIARIDEASPSGG